MVEAIGDALDVIILLFSISGIIILSISLFYKVCKELVIPSLWKFGLYMLDVPYLFLAIGLTLFVAHTRTQDTVTCEASGFFIVFALLQCPCSFLSAGVIISFVQCPGKSLHTSKYHKHIFLIITVPILLINVALSVVPLIPMGYFNKTSPYPVGCLPLRPLPHSGSEYALFIFLSVWVLIIAACSFCIVSVLKVWKTFSNRIHSSAAASNVLQTQNISQGRTWQKLLLFEESLWIVAIFITTFVAYTNKMETDVASWIVMTSLGVTVMVHSIFTVVENILWGSCCCKTSQNNRESSRKLKKLELVKVDGHGKVRMRAMWALEKGMVKKGLMKIYGVNHLKLWAQEIMVLGMLRKAQHSSLLQCQWTSRNNPYYETMTLITGEIITFDSRIICMELTNGGTMKDFLKRMQLSLPETCQRTIIHDVAEGLTHLHSRNILHRNLTSSSIYLKGSLQHMVLRAAIGDFEEAEIYGSLQNGDSNFGNISKKEFLLPDIRSFALVTLELLSRSCEKKLQDRSNHIESEHIPLMMTFANVVSNPPPNTENREKPTLCNHESLTTKPNDLSMVLNKSDDYHHSIPNEYPQNTEQNKMTVKSVPGKEDDIPFSDELFDIPPKHTPVAPRFGNNLSPLPIYTKMANMFSSDKNTPGSNPSDVDELIQEEIDHMTKIPMKKPHVTRVAPNEGKSCHKFEILPDAMYPEPSVANSIKEVLDNSWDSDSTDSFLQCDTSDGRKLTTDHQNVLSKSESVSSVGLVDSHAKSVSRTFTGSSVGSFGNVDITDYLPGIITEEDRRRHSNSVANTGRSVISPIEENLNLIPGTADYADDIRKSTLSLQEMIAAKECESNMSGYTDVDGVLTYQSHILSTSIEEQELEIDDERPDNRKHYSITSNQSTRTDSKCGSIKEQNNKSAAGTDRRQKARKVLSRALSGKNLGRSKTNVISFKNEKSRQIKDDRYSSVKKLYSETKSTRNPLTQHIKANLEKPLLQYKKHDVKTSTANNPGNNTSPKNHSDLTALFNREHLEQNGSQATNSLEARTHAKAPSSTKVNDKQPFSEQNVTVSASTHICATNDNRDESTASAMKMCSSSSNENTDLKGIGFEEKTKDNRSETFEIVEKDCEDIIESIQQCAAEDETNECEEYGFLRDALIRRSKSEDQCYVPGSTTNDNSHIKRITVTPKNFQYINNRKGISFGPLEHKKGKPGMIEPSNTDVSRESSFSSDDEATSSGGDVQNSKLKQRILAKGKSKIKRTLTPMSDSNISQGKPLHKSMSDPPHYPLHSSVGSSDSSMIVQTPDNAHTNPTTSDLLGITQLTNGNVYDVDKDKSLQIQEIKRHQDSGIESGSVTSDISRVNTPVNADSKPKSAESIGTPHCPSIKQPLQSLSNVSKSFKTNSHNKQFNGGVNVFSNTSSNATKRYRELTRKGVPLKVSVVDASPSSETKQLHENKKRQRIVINAKKSASFEEVTVDDSELDEVFKQLDDKGVFQNNSPGSVPNDRNDSSLQGKNSNRLTVVQGQKGVIRQLDGVMRQPLEGIIKEIPDETSDAYEFDLQPDDYHLHQPEDSIHISEKNEVSAPAGSSHAKQNITDTPPASLVMDTELVIDRIFTSQSKQYNYGGTDSEADSGMGLDEDTIRTLTKSSINIKRCKNIEDVALSIGMDNCHFKYCQDLSSQTHLLAFNDLLPARDENLNILASKLQQAGRLGPVGKQLLDLIGECWLSENPPNAETIVGILTDPVSETEL